MQIEPEVLKVAKKMTDHFESRFGPEEIDQAVISFILDSMCCIVEKKPLTPAIVSISYVLQAIAAKSQKPDDKEIFDYEPQDKLP